MATNADRESLEARLQALTDKGVTILDPRQTFIDADVDLDRIEPGATLFPGTRLHGPRTLLARRTSVGREGPAVLQDTALDEGAAVDSGFVKGAVLLRGARAGANAHIREGTLLEEAASTAHAVGLKHTILLGFVTVGSVVNLCDLLIAGGTGRSDHSEVGSGFIHFNFTPWGRRGDKATATLVGDVVEGVFLRSPRVFLGGAGGVVGPRRIGYGSVTGAGQVVRRDVLPGRMVVQASPEVDRGVAELPADGWRGIKQRNVEYIAQLKALEAWYTGVRLARLPAGDAHRITRLVLTEAVATLGLCIAERLERLRAFLEERGQSLSHPVALADPGPCPIVSPGDATADYLEWLKSLPIEAVRAGMAWLSAIAAGVRDHL